MFLYHRVPLDIQGTTLYPLNQLKDVNPNAYATYLEKYRDREHVPKGRIPTLNNCLWNDVIFMIPVHPREIAKAFKETGHGELKARRYYRFDARRFDPAQTTVWLFDKKSSDPTGYIKFDLETLEQYTQIPEKTCEYFLDQRLSGKSPLIFAFIPHVMFKGTIDVSDSEIIEI